MPASVIVRANVQCDSVVFAANAEAVTNPGRGVCECPQAFEDVIRARRNKSA